ncbi:MAG TPA: hypothetical protein VG895_01040 [Patescibacteria group bacterium]|nr:hypothetical protein [Patescibacteria group bacterium]
MENLENAPTNKEVQLILDQLHREFCFRQSHKRQPKIITFKTMLGFSFNSKRIEEFVGVLIEKEIPYLILEQELKSGPNKGKIKQYHFVASRNVNEALAAFTKAGLLQDKPE